MNDLVVDDTQPDLALRNSRRVGAVQKCLRVLRLACVTATACCGLACVVGASKDINGEWLEVDIDNFRADGAQIGKAGISVLPDDASRFFLSLSGTTGVSFDLERRKYVVEYNGWLDVLELVGAPYTFLFFGPLVAADRSGPAYIVPGMFAFLPGVNLGLQEQFEDSSKKYVGQQEIAKFSVQVLDMSGSTVGQGTIDSTGGWLQAHTPLPIVPGRVGTIRVEQVMLARPYRVPVSSPCFAGQDDSRWVIEWVQCERLEVPAFLEFDR